jgi:NADPH:quinone reductase-like Zn-dependent oxidoreductase
VSLKLHRNRSRKQISVVGFVAGYSTKLNIRQLIGPMVNVKGIAVGSRRGFVDMNRAIEVAFIRPAVDKMFNLSEAADAFNYMKSGGHFGKIAVTMLCAIASVVTNLS